MAEKRCFVVMGYGTKTDFATGRKLNLDKSYHALIKPVVESKGIACVRADEIPHSGPIDVPMYRELYTADIVVADISTSNLNAFYELGVRHALRPRTTIIISEDKLCAPFNTNHIKIEKYTHLGESIDYFEVLRFQKKLGEMIDYVLNDTVPDSPVYTFLDNLIPPGLQEQAKKVVRDVNKALSEAKTNSPATLPVEEDINVESSLPKADVKMKDITGKDITLKQASKKNGLLVMFSCNTCPYVIKNQQRTNEMAEYALKNNIGVVLVNSNEGQRNSEDSYEAMRSYAKVNGYKWHYVVDKNSEVADAFGAKRTPEIFLFSSDNKLVYHGAIDDNPSNPDGVNRKTS